MEDKPLSIFNACKGILKITTIYETNLGFIKTKLRSILLHRNVRKETIDGLSQRQISKDYDICLLRQSIRSTIIA